jgi:hypothetical protein
VLSACGLVSSDVTNFDLTLPDKKFSVDTSGWQVDQQAASTYLDTSCTNPAPNVCTTAAAAACTANCSGVCGTNNKCDLQLDVALHQGVDLVMEKPELKTINSEPVIKVTIDSVQYEVTDNTLNVATPPMGVFVAPMSITDPNDPMSQQIGTIDAIPAGSTFPPRDMAYTAAGKQALADTMGTYRTPFNVIVGATLTVKAGEALPSGKLDAIVHITAHAGL